MTDADMQRVTDLYERWVKAGAPPLGVSLARWWDRRLVKLRDAIIHLGPEGAPDFRPGVNPASRVAGRG